MPLSWGLTVLNEAVFDTVSSDLTAKAMLVSQADICLHYHACKKPQNMVSTSLSPRTLVLGDQGFGVQGDVEMQGDPNFWDGGQCVGPARI